VEPINSISWSKDSNFLAFNGKENEKFSLYILDTREKEMLKPVTSLSSDWIFKNLNFWNLSGNKLFFVNGSTVSSFEAKNKKYQLMKDIHKPIITQQWNENQNTVALITKDGEETYLDTLNLETGFLTNIEKRFQIDSPRWSPNGESLSYFIKAKDQTFSKIIILDYLSQKNVWEGDVGEISIYPWDVDPTYSIWSSQSASILFLTKKNDQTQFLSKFSINNNQLMAVTTNWDYIYNFGFSPKDDWIFVTGSRSEKEFIEFISTGDLSQRIEKRDLIFCEWKLDGVKDGEAYRSIFSCFIDLVSGKTEKTKLKDRQVKNRWEQTRNP
jgi:Tol biopolymer transport system component